MSSVVPAVTAAEIIAALGYTPAAGISNPSFYDFAAAGKLGALPSGVTFTRASTGWYTGSGGLIVSAASDVPRYAYDPATLSAHGLLIEESRTELTPKSADFTDASWVKSAASITANANTAPDGTTTMAKLTEDATTAAHTVRKGATFYSFTSGSSYVASVYFKAGARGWAYMQLPAAFGTNLRAYFNLSTGALGTVSAGVTAFIVPVGNGIYRCVMVATATSTASGAVTYAITTADATASHAGDGTSDIRIWGANVQVGDALGSYIPADTVAVTRAADTALITNGQPLADQCYIIKGRTPRKLSGGMVNVAFQTDDGTVSNRRMIRYGSDGRIHVVATVNGVDQCDLDLGALANGTDFAVAARFADGKFAASLNGGAIVTALTGVCPYGLTTARIGRGVTGGYWNSTIRSIETRRTASDTELPLLAA